MFDTNAEQEIARDSEKKSIKLSFVVPVFNEAETVCVFLDRIRAVFKRYDAITWRISHETNKCVIQRAVGKKTYG